MSSTHDVSRLVNRHPFQRLSAPSTGLSALLHLAGLASFSYSFQYLRVTPNPVINESYGWHFQFLTIIGLALATATFAVGLLADLTLSRQLFVIKNALSVCSAPLEVLISLMYWGLKTIDPKLVLPDFAPPLSLPVDWSFHVVPAVALTTDLLFFSPPYTIAAGPAFILAIILAFGYWFWIELCYSHNAFYPYPIFEMLSTPYRVLLFANSALIFFLALWSLKWLYRKINGHEIVEMKASDHSGNINKAQ